MAASRSGSTFSLLAGFGFSSSSAATAAVAAAISSSSSFSNSSLSNVAPVSWLLRAKVLLETLFRVASSSDVVSGGENQTFLRVLVKAVRFRELRKNKMLLSKQNTKMSEASPTVVTEPSTIGTCT